MWPKAPDEQKQVFTINHIFCITIQLGPRSGYTKTALLGRIFQEFIVVLRRASQGQAISLKCAESEYLKSTELTFHGIMIY